jgi:hypothetical protein
MRVFRVVIRSRTADPLNFASIRRHPTYPGISRSALVADLAMGKLISIGPADLVIAFSNI